MIKPQIICRVLDSGDIGLLKNNALTIEHFSGYEEEYEFIEEHYEKYGNVPDKFTFINKFEGFEFIDVAESNRYLIETIEEQRLFEKLVDVVTQVNDIMVTDSNEAAAYLKTRLPELQMREVFDIPDIVGNAESRYVEYLDKMAMPKGWTIDSGFDELDDIIGGWDKGEELAVIFARTGNGKSWVLVKALHRAWEQGYRVGYISPEMSENKIGYRFDTIHSNFSNNALVYGKETIAPNGDRYIDYIKQLEENRTPFYVGMPKDFGKRVTVSKLRSFAIERKLDIIAIDGITYMTDERTKRNDNKTTQLTNISEDLMDLSIELGIPILVVVQSNRGGVKEKGEDGTPDLENIRDSDGIAHNASKVLSVRRLGDGLEIGVKKQRNGATGQNVVYTWLPDTGEFIYMPSVEDIQDVGQAKGEPKKTSTRERVRNAKERKQDNVF